MRDWDLNLFGSMKVSSGERMIGSGVSGTGSKLAAMELEVLALSHLGFAPSIFFLECRPIWLFWQVLPAALQCAVCLLSASLKLS